MHLRVIAVGRIRESYLAEAVADFRRRLRPYHRLEEHEVRAADGADPARAMQSEGDALLKLLAPTDHVWLLERTGRQFASDELATHLEALALGGASRVTFVIAGTYGASPELLARADMRWSLSQLTFLHEWTRAIVMEQLYRAARIAANEPYHH